MNGLHLSPKHGKLLVANASRSVNTQRNVKLRLTLGSGLQNAVAAISALPSGYLSALLSVNKKLSKLLLPIYLALIKLSHD